jgi:hypothetical protein
MIVLDENIPEDQRHTLRGWRIRARQIGQEVGWAGMSDNDIVPLLVTLQRPTFFTRDRDFLQPWLRHPAYGIVYLDVGQYEAASFIRRVLRHRSLNTSAKRMGTVIRAGQDRLAVWRHGRELERLDW